MKVLANLTSLVGVSGYERTMANTLKEMFSEYGLEVTIDDFYNVVAKKKGNGSSSKKILITAHYDEIGLMVKSIDDKGFISFVNIGGIDSKILLSQEVIVHGKKDLYGVIGNTPPHLLKKEDYKKVLPIRSLTVDVGCTKDELKDIVEVGDIITFKSNPIILNEKLMSDKTMDNRAGVLSLLVTAEKIASKDTDMDIYFVATTQEEFNEGGAKTVASRINPDYAIVVDTAHGDMVDAPKEETFGINEGVVIAVGPNLHRKFTNKAIEVAKNNEIPYQIDVEPSNTGTEAWTIQITNCGIPTILLSIPIKYMHTTIEMVHENDILNTAELMHKLVLLNKEELEGCLCY